MNNVEKIIDILLDDKDLNLSVDQCEQIAELLDDNDIGDLQESKKEISSYINQLNQLKDNPHDEKQVYLDAKLKPDAQAKLADEARPNAADAAKNLEEEIIDNIDYWIGGLWVKGYSPSSREVAKTLVELGLVAVPRSDDAAALEPIKWELEEQLDIISAKGENNEI